MNWPHKAQNCCYANTSEGLYSITFTESSWYHTCDADLQEMITTGTPPVYKLIPPNEVFFKSNRFRLSQPLQITVAGNTTRLTYSHCVTGSQTSLSLTPVMLHHLQWLSAFRDGPNAWNIVHRAFERLGLELSNNELNVRKFLSAVQTPQLIMEIEL